MDISLTHTESIPKLEYPSSPPSPPRSPVPQSTFRVSTTIDDSLISFVQISTPSSGTFPRLSSVSSTPPLPIPPQWLWRCHMCGIAYPLGTTRRCLNDGHYFCAGTTVSKKTGKRKIHAPCGSTFDYVGWQKYGDWRRRELESRARSSLQTTTSGTMLNQFSTYMSEFMGTKRGENDDLADDSTDDSDAADGFSPVISQIRKKTHDCSTQCNYPSECRWGRKMSPVKEKKKKRKTKTQSITISMKHSTRPRDAMSITIDKIDKPLQPTKDTTIIQDIKSQQNASEFNIEQQSIRRNRKGSRPFASYSWLNNVSALSSAAAGTVTSPPSSPPSESSDIIEISYAGDTTQKEYWPLNSLFHPLVEESIESPSSSFDFLEMQYLQSSNPRTTLRHRLLTPETTPEPAPPVILGGEVQSAELVECEMGSEADSSSSSGGSAMGSPPGAAVVVGGGDGSPSSLLFDWNWTVGGFSDAWDKRFGTIGEIL